MSLQAQDIINASLRWIGAIAAEETPAAAESSDALIVLNEIIASLSAEEVYLYSRWTDTLTLSIGTNSYTWGPSGSITTTRPLRVLQGGCQLNNVSLPIDILSSEEWSNIADFTAQSSFVSKIYLDNAYPLANLSVWPKPSAASTLAFYSIKALAGFINLTDTFDFPPGYERAIRLVLATELAPEYGRPLTPEMYAMRQEAKAALRALNKQNTLALDLSESPLVSAADPAPSVVSTN